MTACKRADGRGAMTNGRCKAVAARRRRTEARMRYLVWSGICLGLLLVGTPADAVEEFMLTGGKLAKFTATNAQVKVAREPGLTDFPDPRTGPSLLEIRTDLETIGPIDLPAGSWMLDKGKYQFEDPAGSNAGGVTRVFWKSVKLQVKMQGPNYTRPNGPVSWLEVRLTVGPDGKGIGPYSYCARFTNFTQNDTTAIVAKGPSVPCDPLPTPTPDVTDTPTPTSTPTPTPFGCTAGSCPPGFSCIAGQCIAFTPTPTNTPVATNTPTPTPLQPTAFRATTLEVVDPAITLSCNPINSIVNQLVSSSLTQDGDNPPDGLLDLSVVAVFRPLDQSGPGGDISVGIADCTAPVETTQCTENAGSPLQNATYTNQSSGTCLQADPATIGINNSGTTSPPINAPAGPCFVSSAVSATFDFGGILIPLQDAQFAGEYVGDPASQIASGMIKGFLPQSAAESIILPGDLPLVGGQQLSALLNGTNGCANDDRDVHNGVTGWWFYLNFTGSTVPWNE